MHFLRNKLKRYWKGGLASDATADTFFLLSKIFCKSSSPPLANIVPFVIFMSDFPSRFSKWSARDKFSHPYKEWRFLSPIEVEGSHNPPLSGPNILASTPPGVHPLRSSAFSLALYPVSGSDTTCNSPNPPLALIQIDLVKHWKFLLILYGDLHDYAYSINTVLTVLTLFLCYQ